MNLNTAMDRVFLKTVTDRVKHHFPTVLLGDAKVKREGGSHIFALLFNGYWYEVRIHNAVNAVEARRRGWEAFLKSNHVEEI
jgi:hypothetical protein